ncbi:thioredoxin domain-containing protein 5 homolog [Dendronephthya gigantea]|uniref:thioredoxin domain-containing protein 5 homolog n=1 Tax=Dendronephthya gigantea TaxID=151771 RepID=UPI00106A4ABA|nr:thioredoxin domain-containing protein 5 homolog [Dendronephthya gigantea]
MALLRFVFATVLVLTKLWSSEGTAVLEFQKWEELKDDLSKTDVAIVDFFASWCPHCVRLAPSFEKAAETISQGDLKEKVHLIKIQCDSEKGAAICAANKIEGFPTLNVYNKGKKLEQYVGGRQPGDIVEYVQKVVKTKKAQFTGKQKNDQLVCLAKDFKKYAAQKSS